MQKSWYAVGAALALVLLATSPVAAQTQVAFELNSPGSGANLAGVYTSPYTGTINGGSTVPVICDDFADESYVPETWTAYETSLSSMISGAANTSVLKWQPSTLEELYGTPGLSQVQAYEVAAVLSIDILFGSATGSTAQEDYSYALWGLFDPCGNGTNGTSPTSCLSGTPATSGDLGAFGQLETYSPSNLSAAETDLSTAIAAVTSGSANLSNYDVTIYSYDTGATGNCGGTCTPPQEFITVSMAEPPAPALLGVDLLGLAGLILLARRFGSMARRA
jgi:hypothetical protein